MGVIRNVPIKEVTRNILIRRNYSKRPLKNWNIFPIYSTEISTAADPDNFRPFGGKIFYKAFALWVLGLAWMGSALYAYKKTQNYGASALGLLCIAPFYFGFSWLESGLSRQTRQSHRRKRKKKEFSNPCCLRDGARYQDVLMEKGGDIDLSLSLGAGEVCVVDIKSWNYWSGFVRKRDALKTSTSPEKIYGNSIWNCMAS